jgi:hypothetical protein
MTHFHYPIYKPVIGVSYIIVNFCAVQCHCMFGKRPLLILDVQVSHMVWETLPSIPTESIKLRPHLEVVKSVKIKPPEVILLVLPSIRVVSG